jgi:hypothetical protein
VTDRARFRDLALALPHTREAPHFDRTAFRVNRIFATLAADGLSANLLFTPDEQEFKCQLAPEIFSPVGGAWGKQGYTTIILPEASEQEVAAALAMAHAHAVAKRRR